MTAERRWRNFYQTALRACGNKSHQEREADLAIRVCFARLSHISQEKTSELDEIRTALADLRLLKILYCKYRPVDAA